MIRLMEEYGAPCIAFTENYSLMYKNESFDQSPLKESVLKVSLCDACLLEASLREEGVFCECKVAIGHSSLASRIEAIRSGKDVIRNSYVDIEEGEFDRKTRCKIAFLSSAWPGGKAVSAVRRGNASSNGDGPPKQAEGGIFIVTLHGHFPTPSGCKVQAVREFFGLTDVEARIAVKISMGMTLSEIAEAESISIGHARQRLKSVFQKTKTQRQASLAVLVAQL